MSWRAPGIMFDSGGLGIDGGGCFCFLFILSTMFHSYFLVEL